MLYHNLSHSELIQYCFNATSHPLVIDLAERLENSEDELAAYDEALDKIAELEEEQELLEDKAEGYDSALKSLQGATQRFLPDEKFVMQSDILELLDSLLEKFHAILVDNTRLKAQIDDN